jgi:carnitine O-acetyltransferase
MHLPIPELKFTIEKYKLWLRPLVSKSEFERASALAEKFASGVGAKLQDMLLGQADIFTNTSWLYRHWLNSYLDSRETVTIASNFSMDLRFASEGERAETFLPKFISALGLVCKSYRDGEFGNVYDAKNAGLSMNQFAILRGCSRVPMTGRDGYNISDNNSDYATIFYKNNLYKVTLWGEAGMLDFGSAVSEILRDARTRECSLSTICFADGDRAAALRKKYEDANAFFNVVENSLFNISITDVNISSPEDERHYFLYLGGENTWLYKPLNFIYNLRDGKLFINCEHTYQDAGTIVEILRRASENMTAGEEKRDEARALRVEEYFDSGYAEEARAIKAGYSEKIKKFSCMDVFLSVSDEELSGHSKDAVMQALLQYAQMMAFGWIKGTYEAVDMRKYNYGRTECVRPISHESLELIKSMARCDARELIAERLASAESEHKGRIKACKRGGGIDRHLFGLSLMAEMLDDGYEKRVAMEFFASDAYKIVTENFVSTTSIGCLDNAGYLLFTPVVENGVGVTYLKEPDGIRYLISYYVSEREKIEKFVGYLSEGLARLKPVL